MTNHKILHNIDYKRNLNRRRKPWKRREKEKLHSFVSLEAKRRVVFGLLGLSAQVAGDRVTGWHLTRTSLHFPCEVLVLVVLSALRVPESVEGKPWSLCGPLSTPCRLVFIEFQGSVWVCLHPSRFGQLRAAEHTTQGFYGEGRDFLAIIHTHIFAFTCTHAATGVSLASRVHTEAKQLRENSRRRITVATDVLSFSQGSFPL